MLLSYYLYAIQTALGQKRFIQQSRAVGNGILTNSLTKVQSMKHGRSYLYCTVLEEGKVLTIGGFDEWGCNNRLAEV